MMLSHNRPTLVAVIAVAACTAHAGKIEPFFQDLGVLPGSESPFARSEAVSGNGSVVVGRSQGKGGNEAFQWTGGAMVGLGTGSRATGVSTDGTVVVGSTTTGQAGRREAVVWVNGAGPKPLGGLGDGNSEALGVSSDGLVIVGHAINANGHTQAFRYVTDLGMVGLGMMANENFVSQATAASDDGAVISGWSVANGVREAFAWTLGDGESAAGGKAGDMVDLGDLAGGELNSQAFDISDDGMVIVGRGTPDDGFEAVRWEIDELTGDWGSPLGLGNLSGGPNGSAALAVSADGSIIVGTANTLDIGLDDADAFIWDEEHGMRKLQDVLESAGIDLDGWRLTQATGIADDGLTIVGYAFAGGKERAFLARLPEPATALLLLLGLITIGRRSFAK